MVQFRMNTMRLAAGVLLGACGSVAYANADDPRGIVPPGIVPPGIIPTITRNPFVNSTVSATPTISDSSCSASCTVELPAWSALSWVPVDDLVYTSTMTVATKVYSINIKENITLTETQYATLSDGLTFETLATNPAGTICGYRFITGADGSYTYTEIAYPTPFFDYDTSYKWQGVLPTVDKTGNTFCDTATIPNTAVLPSYTPYPQPKAGKPDPEDLTGASYTLLRLPIPKPFDIDFLTSAFPSASALFSCTPTPFPAPSPSKITTVRFLTATQTTYISAYPSAPLVRTEKSVSGFETTTPTPTSKTIIVTTQDAARVEKSQSGFESQKYPPQSQSVRPNRPASKAKPKPEESTPQEKVRIESTQSGWMYPGPSPPPVVVVTPTPPPDSEWLTAAPSVHTEKSVDDFGDQPKGSGIAGPNGNGPNGEGPGGSQASKLPNQNQNPAPTTVGQVQDFPDQDEVKTVAILTTVSGTPMAVVGFVLPDGKTGMIGQTVVVGGQTTVLGKDTVVAAKATGQGPIAKTLETVVEGRKTSTEVWVLPGGETASVGQTVTVGGSRTVLGKPSQTGASQTSGGGGSGSGKKGGDEVKKGEAGGMGSDRWVWVAGLGMGVFGAVYLW